MKAKPKISIITVVYNNAALIDKTIKNVLKQTYSNIEYIIVDGASTDGTLDIIRQYEGQLKYISEKDKGIYDAMNKGARIATGEWLIYRNCGDFFFTPSILDEIMAEYEDQGEDYIGCNVRFFKQGYYKDMRPNILTKHYFEAMPIWHQACLIRRTTQLKYPYNLKYRNSADNDFFIHTFINGSKYALVDKTLTLFDDGDGASALHGNITIKNNIEILLSYNAPERFIEAKRAQLKKWERNNRFCKYWLYRVFWTWNALRSGKYIKCSSEEILKNI